MVVLGIQQEVSAHYCDAYSDDGQNDEHQEHESVHIVHLYTGNI